MFFAVSIHPASARERTTAAAEWHSHHLVGTGRFGTLATRTFDAGALYWDESADHARVIDHPDAGAFLLRAGYSAKPEVWHDDGTHSIEDTDHWGEYAAVKVSDGARGSHVAVWSDPAGSWPLYYGRRDRHCVVSNDPHFVAIALGFESLSTQGGYELLAYHHRIGNETTISGVYGLHAGDKILIDATSRGVEEFGVHSAGTYSYSEPADPALTIDDAYGSLCAATKAIPPLHREDSPPVFTLSGGLDSRLTLSAFAAGSPARPQVVTRDLSTELEVEVAAQVSEILGFPHRVIAPEEMSMADARAGWMLTGGQVSVFAAAGNHANDRLSGGDASRGITIVGAWPGDCLIGSYVPFTVLYMHRSLRRVALRDWSAKRAPLWTWRGVRVAGTEAKRVARRAQSTLRQDLLNASGITAAQSVSHWAMFQRQPRFSYVRPAILSNDVLSVTPMLAPGWIEALMKFSARDLVAKNLYRRLIVEKLPSLRNVAYANTGAPITDEERLPRWPRRPSQVFPLLPVDLQWGIRRLFGRKVARPSDTTESARWRELFAAAGASPVVTVNGLTVDATTGQDLHVISVGLGLQWTREYLGGAPKELGEYPEDSGPQDPRTAVEAGAGGGRL